jgi:hypothetical protein
VQASWEAARPSAEGGQLPGGAIWEFRADGTYARAGALMLDGVEGEAPSMPRVETTALGGCSWSSFRVAASGARSARIYGANRRRGTYAAIGDQLRLQPQGSVFRFRLSELNDEVRLEAMNGSARYELRRVDWYRLPSAEALEHCAPPRP